MVITLTGIVFFGSCSGTPPKDLGVEQGKLKPCPSSPNCVSSYADDDEHAIEPYRYSMDKEAAYEKMVQILKTEKRVIIVEESERYIRAEFKTAIMRFVDDVEFLFDIGQTIHIRSASRLGHSDLGLNRKRMERIRKRFSGE